jgi:uncharacterized coiled-coil protein SlyX
MAQLRAKQIKLAAAGDLLIGGTDGNGSVLSKGTNGQLLKIVGGALAYGDNSASEVSFTPGGTIAATTVQAAIAEVATDAAADLATEVATLEAADTALDGRLDTAETDIATLETDLAAEVTRATAAEGDLTFTGAIAAETDLTGAINALATIVGDGPTELQAEVDAIETAVGLNIDGTYTAIAGGEFVGETSIKADLVALDTALSAVKVTADAAATDADLTTLEGRVTTAEGDITALDGRVDTAETDIDTLQTTVAALGTEVNAIETTVGAKTDGTANYYANGNYIVQGADAVMDGETEITPAVAPDNHTVAIGKLDAALDATDTVVAALQSEVDATQAGAGLTTAGGYASETASNYINTATTLKEADFLLDAAIKVNADAIAVLSSATDFGGEIDAIEAAVGLNADGTLAAYTGTNYLNAASTIKAATVALDTALKAEVDAREDDVLDLQQQINSLVGLDTMVFKGIIDGTITAGDLATNFEATAEIGDVYRVSVPSATFADQGFDVNVGDFVAYIGLDGSDGKWVKFDNTDPTLESSDASLTVTGNTFTGFDLALVKEDITSANTAITVTGGTSAALAGVELTFNAGNVDFADLAGVGTPEDGKFLKWDATAGEIVYVSAAELGVVTHSEEDFTPTTAADVVVTLAHAAVTGSVAVFINGVKLRKTGYTVSGTTVTMVDSVNGYGVETGDVVSVSYDYAA